MRESNVSQVYVILSGLRQVQGQRWEPGIGLGCQVQGPGRSAPRPEEGGGRGVQVQGGIETGGGVVGIALSGNMSGRLSCQRNKNKIIFILANIFIADFFNTLT